MNGGGTAPQDALEPVPSFAEQLRQHFRSGTRPQGSPGRPGRQWSAKEFADAVGLDVRTINYWLRGERGPDDGESAERALFGSEVRWDAERVRLRAGLAAMDRKPSVLTNEPLLAPDRCFGRDFDVDTLTSLIISGPTAVAILGPPGIGKSTLMRRVATGGSSVTCFGPRRWYVRSDSANDAEALRVAIVLTLSLNPATKTFRDALIYLAKKPSLLLLDNLETPWERDTAAVQDCLRLLLAIPTVTLLVSMRGNVTPTGPTFAHRILLEPLAGEVSKRLFLTLASNIGDDDLYLDRFLGELGGVPLAIELVAYRAAAHGSLQELWKDWERRGVVLATHPDLPEERLTSVVRSIDLSLQSPRLHTQGRHLFWLLGQLPAGIAREDRAVLMGEEATEAKRQLLVTGLALTRDRERLDLLPPIRDFAKRMFKPPEVGVTDPWFLHYLQLLTGPERRVGAQGGTETATRLVPEIANLEAAFAAAHRSGETRATAAAVLGFTELVRFTGAGTSGTLLTLSEARQAAGDDIGAAECARMIGDIMRDRSDSTAAQAAYEHALALFGQANDKTGRATCIYSLGTIAIARSDYKTAEVAFQDALQLFRETGHRQGMASCLKAFGETALGRCDYKAARIFVEGALTLFESMEDEALRRADCIQSLGDIALACLDYDQAETAYNRAIPLFKTIGALLGEANCIRSLGDVSLSRGDNEAAQAAYEHAQLIYRQIGSEWGYANCVKSLGHLHLVATDYGSPESLARARVRGRSSNKAVIEGGRGAGVDDEAFRKYEEAAKIFHGLGAVVSEADCIKSLGIVAFRWSDKNMAISLYKRAFSLYEQSDHPQGMGMACYLLAEANEGIERAMYMQKAREIWTSISRFDLVSRLSKLE